MGVVAVAEGAACAVGCRLGGFLEDTIGSGRASEGPCSMAWASLSYSWPSTRQCLSVLQRSSGPRGVGNVAPAAQHVARSAPAGAQLVRQPAQSPSPREPRAQLSLRHVAAPRLPLAPLPDAGGLLWAATLPASATDASARPGHWSPIPALPSGRHSALTAWALWARLPSSPRRTQTVVPGGSGWL